MAKKTPARNADLRRCREEWREKILKGAVKRNIKAVRRKRKSWRKWQAENKYAHQIRNAVCNAIRGKGYSKKSRTYEILGADYGTVEEHLLKGFHQVYARYPTKDDVLHIDHIIPMKTATTEEEVLKLNHYTNLRYLLAADNHEKAAKLDWVYVVKKVS